MRLAVLIALLGACDSGGDDLTPDAGPDAGPPPDAYVDLSGPVFAPDHIVEVSITMAPTDWDTLRGQTRTFNSIIEGDCLAQPQPSPFTKFQASITIDGATFPQVSVKKKGFIGSLDPDKPSLKVAFDEYVPGQEYLGLEKLTLNNSHQDPAYVRQCIAYQTFGAAGIVVPRCNFAHVRVNGADLGIYVNVEAIDHHLTKKRYADGTGTLYEGTLSDLRPGWTGTFDPKGGGTGDDLLPVASAIESATDANLVTAVSPYIDVDRYMTFWAMEIITNHWDGFANDRNNFFVYHDPTTGKFDFIPWGTDGTLQNGATFGKLGETNGPIAVAANALLPNRLFSIATTRDQFLARQRQLLISAFDETKLLAEIDRMEALIGPIVDSVEGTSWRTDVDGVRTFINGRRAKLTAALDAGPTWTEPLGQYPCLAVVAQINGSFSTTWGTIGNTNPFSSGTGTMSLTIGGVTTTLTPVGSKAGLDPNPQPNTEAQAIVQVVGVRPADNHIIVFHMVVRPAWFFPRMGNLGFFDSFALVFDYDPGTTQTTTLGFVLGEFTLTQASTTAGQPVTGSFSGNVDTQGTPP